MTSYHSRRNAGDSFRKSMSGIANDLWGEPAAFAAEESTASPSASKPDEKQEAEPQNEPKVPPLEDVWKVADEPIDWTEVLASPESPDGLTPQAQWDLYRQYAEQVLSGDLDAYRAVLSAVEPLKDLLPYADSISAEPEDADKLTACWTVQEARYQADGERYVCTLSLRIARDLLSVLPVNHVVVTAMQGEKPLNRFDFPRKALQKVKVPFADPIALVHSLE